MAKVQTKTKTKRSKKKVDPLTVSLKLLALADKETMRAIRCLNRAILSPVREPKIVECGFKLHKKRYHARVTIDQCERILKVVGENGNVLALVTSLLAALTKQIAGDLDGFAAILGIRAKTRIKPMSGTKTVPLGCCVYSGGQTPNLTQSQCQQFNPTQWDQSDPGCTNSPLMSK